MFNRRVSWMTLVCVALIVAMASSTLTLALIGMPAASPDTQENPLARAQEIYDTVLREYYTDVDAEALATGAIDGMLATLGDPYTFYYTPEAYQSMNEETTGHYSGVGMLVGESEDGSLTVMRVFRDSPAEAAGIQTGDVLVSVDGTRVGAGTSLGLAQALDMLKGDGVTPVDVEVSRGGEVLGFTLARGAVNINYVEYSVLEGNVGYLSIYQFTGDDVSGVEEALSAFQAAGVQALVVDVRSNPGGLLDDVVEICDMLVPEGLIVYTQNRQGEREEYYADSEYWDVPMAVLVNGDSASASEIFAAAVQDSGRGVIVGETTFGKGLVQTLYSFAEGDGVQITTSAYYTPSGKSIHGQGVTPDIEVALAADASVIYHAPDAANDAQLRAALDALKAGN